MKEGTRNNILKFIVVLAVLGLFISIYLTQEHFAGAEGGSGCDISDTISCSLVNTSKYSEIFHVPVAVFGAIWMVILGALAISALKKPQPSTQALLAWSVAGFIFLFYLIGSEILLKAICPWCTVVHVIILIVFGLSIALYKSLKNPKITKKDQATIIKLMIVIGLLMLIPLGYFNLGGEQVDFEEFTACLNDSGLKMYGSFRCGVCAKTRNYFGDAFHNIDEIECHPQGENPQPELCFEVGVEKTPTWIVYDESGNEIARADGFQNEEKLSEMTGCSLDLINRGE